MCVFKLFVSENTLLSLRVVVMRVVGIRYSDDCIFCNSFCIDDIKAQLGLYTYSNVY